MCVFLETFFEGDAEEGTFIDVGVEFVDCFLGHWGCIE